MFGLTAKRSGFLVLVITSCACHVKSKLSTSSPVPPHHWHRHLVQFHVAEIHAELLGNVRSISPAGKIMVVMSYRGSGGRVSATLTPMANLPSASLFHASDVHWKGS